MLDVQSILPDRVLLLDSFFYVVVFHGSTVVQWRKEGYHLDPQHAQFKRLLEVSVLISIGFSVSLPSCALGWMGVVECTSGYSVSFACCKVLP